MSLLSRLALLFVGLPLLELFVLVQMGRLVGLWPTIGLVVLTGFAGAALARLEGLRTLWKIRGELARGRLPGHALFDGLAILVGGALLLTPGILTDLLGFSFLLPPTRKLLLGRIRRSLESRLKSGAIQVTHFSCIGGAAGWMWEAGGGGSGGSPDATGWTPPIPKPSGEIVLETEEEEAD
jgi:UPF0716 protein FxsA